MKPQTLIQAIASTGIAKRNCAQATPPNHEWHARHSATLATLAKHLPSGSGIDNGTRILRADADSVVLALGFHHMNDHGAYDGWTDHEIVATPSWDGISIRVTGPNRNDIHEYLAEVYQHALTEPAPVLG